MSANPTLRPAESSDAERVRELVESSMTTSYALSPQDIETILDAEFATDALRDRFADDETVACVAEVDGVLAGFVEATVDDDTGVVRWLHVDPERRGAGAGTALFERAVDEFDDRGVEETRAVTLAANTSAGAFFERFGFEQVEERQTEFGGRETIEYEYADDASGEQAAEQADSGSESGDEADFPDTVTMDDGTKLYLGDEAIPGTEGRFAEAFSDEERTEQYGYYCANCGSLDVSMDDMERLRCGNCGNTHKPDEYDAAYL